MLLLPLILTALLAAPPTAAASTCTTVVVRNDLDPTGFPFGNRFADHLAINAAGDVAFIARPFGARQRLYVYPAVGPDEVVATGATAAPAGATFRNKPFSDVALNDAGDLAFLAGLDGLGQALLVRPANLPLAIAIHGGDAAPVGGSFDEILEMGPLASDGTVSFIATTTSGLKGVFVYDLATTLTSAGVIEGDAVTTPPGRFLCTIKHAAIASGGHLAVRANSKTDCSASSEPALEGVYHRNGGTLTRVALTGDATPVAATVYADVIGVPRVNASGHVAFLAKLDGATRKRAIFAWDGVTTTPVVVAGDVEPATGGTLKKINSFALTDAGDLVVSSKFKGGIHRQAILAHGASTSVLLAREDAPPSDRFAPDAEYRTFGKKTLATASGGPFLVTRAKIKDVAVPKGKVALIRCSP